MLKRLLLMCLILMFMLPSAQSQHDQPIPGFRLEPVEWLDANKEYTVIGHKSAIIAEPLLLALYGDEAGANVTSGADMEQTVMKGSALLENGFRALSVSPDGQRILCSESNQLFVLAGDTLRAVALNLSRCVFNREGMEQAIWYASLKPSQMIGAEGYIWSPDGKHLCVMNARMALANMRSVPLMLIDTEKGEMFSIKTYQKGNIRLFSTAMQGLFSADSRYLYYTEFLSGATRLCRYDLTHETHKLLADTHERLPAFPGLGMNAQGEIISFVAGTRHNALLAFKEGPAGWVFRQSPLPSTSIVYFAASREGSLTESMLNSAALVKPMFNLSIGGQPYRLEVQLSEQQAVRFILSAPLETMGDITAYREGISKEQTGEPFICHAAMAPDGSRYLLIVKPDNSSSPVSFWVMDAHTGKAEAVLTPEEMNLFQPSWTRGRAAYQPGIVFLSEDLLLVPDTAGKTQLYRLARYSPF